MINENQLHFQRLFQTWNLRRCKKSWIVHASPQGYESVVSLKMIKFIGRKKLSWWIHRQVSSYFQTGASSPHGRTKLNNWLHCHFHFLEAKELSLRSPGIQKLPLAPQNTTLSMVVNSWWNPHWRWWYSRIGVSFKGCWYVNISHELQLFLPISTRTKFKITLFISTLAGPRSYKA